MPASRLVTLVALLIFAFQGYVVQTHIHGVPLTSPASAAHVTAPQQLAGQENPLAPDNCPLCREWLQNGAFLSPTPVDFTILLGALILPPLFQLAARAEQAPPHDWQSRAPPRR